MKDVARTDTAHTSVNNALGVFSHLDRAKQVEEEATVVLLTASNYKVSPSVGNGHQKTSTACCVLDTGSGLNLIRKSCVPAGVQRQAIPNGLPAIVAANKSRVPVDGMVRMVVKIGDVAQVKTTLVTEHLPVDLILGTSWMDQHVEAIWPQRRVVTLVTRTVAIEFRDATKKPMRLVEPIGCATDGGGVDPSAVRLARSSISGKPTERATGTSGKWNGGVCGRRYLVALRELQRE